MWQEMKGWNRCSEGRLLEMGFSSRESYKVSEGDFFPHRTFLFLLT